VERFAPSTPSLEDAFTGPRVAYTSAALWDDFSLLSIADSMSQTVELNHTGRAEATSVNNAMSPNSYE